MIILNHKSNLHEVTRWQMINASRQKSPDRFAKRVKYSPKDFRTVDFEDLFEEDRFTWRTRVHGEDNYICTISFEGAFEYLKYNLSSMRGKNRWKRITINMVAEALSKSLDSEDLYIDCTCPDFCLEENTLIKLLNGETTTIKDIHSKFNNGEELWVYSVDSNGDFKPGKITDVWISGQVKELIKVTLDNGKSIITTPNHRYMLRNGDYVEADKLVIGQSLMPLYFSYQNGYENVMLNSKVKSFVSVYKTVANELLQKEIDEAKVRSKEDNIAIHHSDFNKLNNYPSNLKPMGIKEHWLYHSNHVKDNPELLKKFIEAGQQYWKSAEGRKRKSEEMKANIQKYWDSLDEEGRKLHSEKNKMTAEGRKKVSDSKKAYWKNLDEKSKKEHAKKFNELVNLSGKAAKAVKAYWKNMSAEEYEAKCKSISEQVKAHPATTTEKKRKANSINGKKAIVHMNEQLVFSILKSLVDNNLIINEENYEKIRPKHCLRYQTALSMGIIDKFNHKVKSIETIKLDEPVNVYDLTIDKYNNFYVDAGVVLHNCYRFAFWCTQDDCKYGLQQNTPPKVRNVNNNKGYVCKHLLALLYGKRWVRSAAKAWLDYMRANPDLTEYYIWGKKIESDYPEEDEELDNDELADNN